MVFDHSHLSATNLIYLQPLPIIFTYIQPFPPIFKPCQQLLPKNACVNAQTSFCKWKLKPLLYLALPPTQIAKTTSEFTPAPTSFTISYTPVTIPYPDPIDPAAQLPTDAIQVTHDQLMSILQQSYIHGLEDGWKTHFAAAKESLQDEYDLQHLKTLLDLDRHCQESYEAGIQEE